jgi:hypothetical protein
MVACMKYIAWYTTFVINLKFVLNYTRFEFEYNICSGVAMWLEWTHEFY